MMQRPRALDSPYELGRVNPEISLAEGRGILLKGKTSLELDEIHLSLESRPSLAITFHGAGTSTDHELMLDGFEWSASKLHLPELGLRARAFRETVQVSGDFTSAPFKIDAGGTLRDVQGGRAKRLRKVLFHLANFPDFLGSFISDDGKGAWRGRRELSGGGWNIVLDSRRKLNELLRELGDEGGFAITHVGSLDKGGASFSRAEAEDVLIGLHWFLSFVRGAWCTPMLFVGEGSAGANWVLLSAGRTDRWSGGFRWCDHTNWTSVQDAYTTYARLWADPAWQRGLRVAIGLYVSANRPNPIETAIITAQSGLELVGWLRFVETNQVRAADWDKTKAATKIRRLMNLAKVNVAIPGRFGALKSLNPNWRDGPDVVAGVRNRLVHPKRKQGLVGWSGRELIQAWLLSSRYLELALLHALEVKGKIRNRLRPNAWVGVTFKPPWI